MNREIKFRAFDSISKAAGNMTKKIIGKTKENKGKDILEKCKYVYFFVTKKTVKKHGKWELPTDTNSDK